MRHFSVPLGALAGFAMLSSTALAADHAEAPGTAADSAADIADFYAWHDADSIYAVLTFAGLTAAGGSPTYDADVLYTIHIDSDGDNEPDSEILFRFGQDSGGAWGVQASDLPGADAVVSGAVGETISSNNAMLYAGLHDDPFFFDLQGYLDTLSTATLMFDGTRDSLAGTNVTAIVVAMDRTAAASGSDFVQLWATTARK